jgi:hypothetical protein
MLPTLQKIGQSSRTRRKEDAEGFPSEAVAVAVEMGKRYKT